MTDGMAASASDVTLRIPKAAPAPRYQRDAGTLTPSRQERPDAQHHTYPTDLGNTLAQPAIPAVTSDDLIRHRLHELEQFATGARQTERDVDTIKLALTDFDRRLTMIQTAMEKNDGRITASLARLHERLDEAMTEAAREEGREEGRVQARAEVEAQAKEAGRQLGLGEARTSTRKAVAWAIGTTLMFGMLIVAALNFALN